MIKHFSILDLAYDKLRPEVAVGYVLDVDIVQLTPADNLRSSSSPHLTLEFFLTGDRNALKDESIPRITLDTGRSADQLLALKVRGEGREMSPVLCVLIGNCPMSAVM